MNSHVIPVHKMNTGKGRQDPGIGKKCRFHTGARVYRTTKEIRRAGEQTSPRWRAQPDIPSNGTSDGTRGGGSGSGSSPVRRCLSGGQAGGGLPAAEGAMQAVKET